MVTPPSLWIPYSGIYWPLSIGGWLSSLLWRLNIPFEWDLGVKMSNKCLKMGDTRKIAILRVNDDQVASGVSCFQTNPSQIKYICFKSNTIVLGRSKTRKSIHGIDYSTIYILFLLWWIHHDTSLLWLVNKQLFPSRSPISEFQLPISKPGAVV